MKPVGKKAPAPEEKEPAPPPQESEAKPEAEKDPVAAAEKELDERAKMLNQMADGIAPVISLEERQAQGVAIEILKKLHALGPMKANEIRTLKFMLPDGKPFFMISVYKKRELVVAQGLPAPPKK